MEIKKYEYKLLLEMAKNKDLFAMKELVNLLFNNNTMNIIKNQNEKEKIFKYLNILIENGDNASMLMLGALHYGGETEFVEQDYNKALYWYEKASKAKPLEKEDDNNMLALNNLGYIYLYGRTGEPDYKKAFLNFAKSACLGYGNAMYKIGDMYYKGQYVKKNIEYAVYWYKKAIDFSYSDKYIIANIYLRLGDIYLNGHGVKKLPFKAYKYLQKAEKLFYILGIKKPILSNSIFAKSQINRVHELIEKTKKELDKLL